MVEGLKATAAPTLHEEKLPFAFYGITALPLLVVFAIASRRLNDRKRFEFSMPMQHYVTMVAVILVAVSLTNFKAAFLVNAISAIGFLFYAVMFRDRLNHRCDFDDIRDLLDHSHAELLFRSMDLGNRSRLGLALGDRAGRERRNGHRLRHDCDRCDRDRWVLSPATQEVIVDIGTTGQ